MKPTALFFTLLLPLLLLAFASARHLNPDESKRSSNSNSHGNDATTPPGFGPGKGGFFGPGQGGFGIPGYGAGNWWGNPGGGYGAGYGGPGGGYTRGGIEQPSTVCTEKGPCYNKKLTCPAKCFTSYSRAGRNYGGGGGGGGCTMDCKKNCVAYC